MPGASVECPTCGAPMTFTRAVLDHGLVGSEEAWALLEEDALSDAKIAGHEAGHALIAHFLGVDIDVVNAYKGERMASVEVTWPPGTTPETTSLVASAGIAAELILGGASYPCASCNDLSKNSDPAHIGVANQLIEEHHDAFLVLQQCILTARLERTTIDGPVVHELLSRHGVSRGEAVTRP